MTPDFQGRTPQQVSNNEDAAAICLAGIAVCLLVAGAFAVARAIWGLI